MASDTLSLPFELIATVAAPVEWKDYAACRLTCRRIEAAMFQASARDSFTKRHVMRTPESVQTLIDVSKSRLSPFVKCLCVYGVTVFLWFVALWTHLKYMPHI